MAMRYVPILLYASVGVVDVPITPGVLVAKEAAFSSSPRVRAAAAAFTSRCSAMVPSLKEHAQRYHGLERVLAFELPAWQTQGIGTLMWWYAGAWSAGMRHKRAVFLSNGDARSFQINRLFHAEAFSRGRLVNWNWADPAVRAAVGHAMARFGLTEPDAHVDVIDNGHQQACEHRTRRATSAGASGSAGGPFSSLDEALDSLNGSRWVVVRLRDRRDGRPVEKWPTRWLARIPKPDQRESFDCLTAAVLQSAPAVQRAVLPVLERAEGRALGGLHLRTGALDIIVGGTGGGVRKACTREEESRQAALLGLARVGGLGGGNRSAARAQPWAAPPVKLSLERAWALWARMAAENCPRCGSADQADTLAVCKGLAGVDAEAPALAGRGTFGRILACALARSTTAARGPPGSARLFLSTDSAGMLDLLRATPAAMQRVLTSEHAPAHVQCDRTRERLHDACGSASRQQAAELKAAADLAVLGLSDWLLQFSTSTFFTTALMTNALAKAGEGGRGECQRGPWSEVGCNRKVEYWAVRCSRSTYAPSPSSAQAQRATTPYRLP